MVSIVEIGTTSGNDLQGPTAVHRASLVNDGGATLDLLDLGASIDMVRLPDRNGRIEDVALTLDTIREREDRHLNPYFGATVGRFANRLSNGSFKIGGVEYQLPTNNGANHLHGGPIGFSDVVWDLEPHDGGVRFSRISETGEMGYPGRLEVSVTYRLDDEAIVIDFEATTDAPTIVSLTNHTYWNLGGPGESDVLDHMLRVPADRVVPVKEDLIPVGPPEPVDGTAFDLRESALLGDRIGSGLPGGYDHCFLPGAEGFRRHATLSHGASGRWLEMWSNMPGLQVYTGGLLSGRVGGRERRHPRFGAICLEPEHLPDAPNLDWAPPPLLVPNHRYHHHLEVRFGVD